MANEPTIDVMNEAIVLFMGGTRVPHPEQKIYDLLAEMAKQRPPHTACHGDMIEVDIHRHIMEYNITGAHKSIYEFVTWYNQQKQNDDTNQGAG